MTCFLFPQGPLLLTSLTSSLYYSDWCPEGPPWIASSPRTCRFESYPPLRLLRKDLLRHGLTFPVASDNNHYWPPSSQDPSPRCISLGKLWSSLVLGYLSLCHFQCPPISQDSLGISLFPSPLCLFKALWTGCPNSRQIYPPQFLFPSITLLQITTFMEYLTMCQVLCWSLDIHSLI